MTNNKKITTVFVTAAAMNVCGVIIFSRFFTNEAISKFDPVVMSNFGLLMIVVWGFTYLSVAKDYQRVKWLIGAFSIEKLIYGIIWAKWMLNNSVSEVFAEDTMAGIFYSIYGINDWLFFLFFTYVFFKLVFSK